MEEALATIRDVRHNLPPSSARDDAVREEMLRETRKLMLELERPENVIIRIGFQLLETVAADVATNMGLFEAVNKAGRPLNVSELAKECHAEENLVYRIARCLASYGALGESEGGYSASVVSRTFATQKGTAAIHGCLEFLSRGWTLLPQQLKEQNYRIEGSKPGAAFQKAYRAPGKGFFEILNSSGYLQDMGVFFSTFNEGHQSWFNFYPVEGRLVRGAHTGAEATFLVDVGGGHGTQAAALRAKFPSTPGRFVNQDLSFVLPSEAPPGVELMAHDFFDPQPIQGARLYYLRYIAHDWPQDRVIAILKRLRAAMEPGYSKLIINEWLVPEKGPSIFMTSQDLNMLCIANGEERSEARHRQYIEAAGLVVSGIWNPNDGVSESVIECEAP